MYFRDRREAGEKLARELANYKNKNAAILALSDGAVQIGEPIAQALRGSLSLLLTEPINLNDLGGQSVGVIDQMGNFTYNQMIPAGLLEEVVAESRNIIEETKSQKLFKMTSSLTHSGVNDPHFFDDQNVILVSDGLKNGLSIEAAVNFLKPIRIEKLIAATPIASVAAVDIMHIRCDELHVLSVLDTYLDTNHYYENNQIGDIKKVMEAINKTANK